MSIYQPLDQSGSIRILTLQPGERESQICCSLETALIEVSNFKALSYEWGPVGTQRSILLNGAAFSVRENLWWALWYLRSSAPRKLWIDALCINQRDEIERGNQVALMGKIYRGVEVICWLGRGDHGGRLDKAMAFIKAATSNDELAPTSRTSLNLDGSGENGEPPTRYLINTMDWSGEWGTWKFPASGKSSVAARESPDAMFTTHKEFANIEALCSHSNWRRTWVIQEAVLGKRISICIAGVSIDGGHFEHTVRQILMTGLNSESLLMLDAIRILTLRECYGRKQEIGLLSLMHFSLHSACLDLRDRAYAMIGLASDCQKRELVPDYSKTLTEVYEDIVFRHFYRGSRSFDGDASWHIIYVSQLVQKAFWGFSESSPGCVVSRDVFQKEVDLVSLKVNGIWAGTITNLKPPSTDSLWWAHEGLVKNIKHPTRPETLHQQWIYRSTWSWLSKSVHETEERTQEAIIKRHHDGEEERIYVPSHAVVGDDIINFVNSEFRAVFHWVGSHEYHLVGRAMKFDTSGDLDIFEEGVLPDSVQIANRRWDRNCVALTLTTEEVRSLTSPYH